MTRSAFVLGGTGLIGRALVPLLVDSGFDVTVGSRTELSDGKFRHVRVDRASDGDFDAATHGDHDLFVDIVAYSDRHARQLERLQGRVRSLVVISSASVYADADGNTLLGSEAAHDHEIVESDPVVAPVPDGSDYAGGKVAVEQRLLGSDLPATVLRPGAIFGPGDRASREWHFVKRVLDGRRSVILADNGGSRFHHVSSTNVAAMVVAAGENPGSRLVNCGDPSPRNVRGICDAVAGAMEHDWKVVGLEGPADGSVGETPWSVPHAFVMDLAVAREELGWSGTSDYETSIGETCRWLVDETNGVPWEEALPKAAAHYGNLFDYAAEDDFLRRRRRQ